MNLRISPLLFTLGLLLSLGTSRAAECEDPVTLRFAVFPKRDLQLQITEYRPLIQVLEKTLKKRVEVVLAASYGTVVEGLVAGRIDLAELGPAAYAQVTSRDASVTAFASTSQRKGPHTASSTQYQSLLVVRSDRNLDTLASLRGTRVSLIDPASTSGALVPRNAIPQLTGQPLESYFGRVTFAGSHDRAIQAVQKGLVDAAFVSSSRLDEALRRGSLRPDELRIVWQSSPLPYDPFVYRTRLCSAVIERIQHAFFQENAALQEMFKTLNVEGFVRANDDQYTAIRSLYAAQR